MQNKADVLKEADRCLNCKNPQCMQGCPVETHIPEFISKIKEENFEEAYEILQENNVLTLICSLICPTEMQCMNKCIRGIKGEPVRINFLENAVNQWEKENKIEHNKEINKSTGIKVAVIGSGPAGLSCSNELLKNGYTVTLFDKEEELGGVLRYGIPDSRLDKTLIDEIVERLKQNGLNIKTGVEFGKDCTLEYLFEQQYNAVFLAIGTHTAKTYMLTEEKCGKIYKANEFLNSYNKGQKIESLGKTIIIGGGNVAVDVAIASLELKAKEVTIVYRKSKEKMPARKIEIKELEELGVKILENTKVISGQMAENKAICIKTKQEGEQTIDIADSKFIVPADTIIFAIGSKIDEELFNNLHIDIENHLIKVDENYMTSKPGVFAGGDLVETKSTVARAVATGKKAAKGIMEFSLLP